MDTRGASASATPSGSSERERPCFWIDAGNGPAAGQILVGRNRLADGRVPVFLDSNKCSWLPLPSEQMPNLMEAEADEEQSQESERLSCAELAMLGKQGPVINKVMAAMAGMALESLVVWNDLRYFQTFYNARENQPKPIWITPENLLPWTTAPEKPRKGGQLHASRHR